MPYEHFARLHTTLLSLRREEGQGTVEYVGVLMVVAAIIAAVVSQVGKNTDIGSAIVDNVTKAINNAGR